jgi:CxxC motif-containing protein
MVGSAVITGWDKNVVAITATKKAGLEDNLRICEFITEHNAGATSVSTGYVKGETVPYITSACIFDIEIFVPYTTTVTVDSISNITIQNINAEVHVETTSGTVKAHNIDGTFIASVEQKGPIILEDMHGTVDVSTASGDIFVENSYKGIRARTYYGTIKVVCAQVPHNSTIDLETQSHGIIELALPEGTQATIAGTTEHGRILSTIPITLARRTTVLTKRAYKKIPKRMKGIIGESGQAKIKLVSTQGIRITSRAH